MVLGGLLVLGGCAAAGSGTTAGGAESSATEVSGSGPNVSPGPTNESGAEPVPGTPEQAVHAIALTGSDLPAGWTVEESPTDADLTDDPTFQGLCNYEFRSESRRAAKDPVTGLNPDGVAVLTSEAVAYDAAEAAELALIELRDAYQGFPPDQIFTDIGPIDQSGLAADRVVVEYTLAEGTTQTVIAQRRGAVLSVILGEARLITLESARSIFARMSALSPEAAGER